MTPTQQPSVTQADGALMIKVSRLIASMHVNLATEEEVAAWALKEIARHREASTADLRTENERLRDLLDRAAKSLERNLYRQAEKLEWIAPAIRVALSAQPSEREGGEWVNVEINPLCKGRQR